MEENICYLPLGSRLNLSFSEDIPLKEITMYEECCFADGREEFYSAAIQTDEAPGQETEILYSPHRKI